MYYIYILANKTNSTIYTGMTNDLFRRVEEHRNHVNPNSFTAKYHVTKLVYFECSEDVSGVINREKQIKSWSRKRKEDLIESLNPAWEDLLPKLLNEEFIG